MMMMMMIVEPSVECELAGETEALGENLPQHHFVHHGLYYALAYSFNNFSENAN
jgi:hypothetical protein